MFVGENLNGGNIRRPILKGGISSPIFALPANDHRRMEVDKKLAHSSSRDNCSFGIFPNPDAEAYKVSRDAFSYIDYLDGYFEFLNYISSIEPNRLLDLGAGSTIAISQISKEFDILEQTEVIASVLNRIVSNPAHLPDEQIIQTSAEYLELEDSSLSGIVSVACLGYAHPEFSAIRIGDVLAPGGAIKASFVRDMNGREARESLYRFKRALGAIGFDLETFEDKKLNKYILTGIKPPSNISAAALMQQDLNGIERQKEYLKSKGLFPVDKKYII